MLERAENQSVSAALVQLVATRRFDDLGDDAVEVCRQCLLDILGVAIAARREPSVLRLIELDKAEGGTGQAVVIGTDRRTTPAMSGCG